MNSALMLNRAFGRRALLFGGVGGALLIAFRLHSPADQAASTSSGPVTNVKITESGAREDTVTLTKDEKKDEEWRKQK